MWNDSDGLHSRFSLIHNCFLINKIGNIFCIRGKSPKFLLPLCFGSLTYLGFIAC